MSRDPKDDLISSWLFTKKLAALIGAIGTDAQSFISEEAFLVMRTPVVRKVSTLDAIAAPDWPFLPHPTARARGQFLK